MRAPARLVTPELLDGLPPEDPRARRARRDLQRLHRAMGTARILRQGIARLGLPHPPRRILELGAGDGSLMLRLARTWTPGHRPIELTLLDRVDVVGEATECAYRELGWRVVIEPADACTWASAAAGPRYDLCLTTLFLHHFDAPELGALLSGIATRADAFVACEPRRAHVARLGSRLVGVLGSSAVTREDAVRSVAAGFAGDELSGAWSRAVARPGAHRGWLLEEYTAGLFLQVFAALRLPAAAHGRPDAR